jgi:hypothetical protein
MIAVCDVCKTIEKDPRGWFSIRTFSRDAGLPRRWIIEPYDGHPNHPRWKVACGPEHAKELLSKWMSPTGGCDESRDLRKSEHGKFWTRPNHANSRAA